MEIFISDFPEYESRPSWIGKSVHEDSKVFDLEFEKDGVEYDVRALISITYERIYELNTHDYQGENYSDLTSSEINVIKGVKYIEDEQKTLGDKELRRIETFIKENLNIL